MIIRHDIKLIVCIMLLIMHTCQSQSITQSIIQQKIKTQHIYKSPNQPQSLYSIALVRTSSSQQLIYPSCHTNTKSIVVKSESQIFRLKAKSQEQREETIFQKLTTLKDTKEIIEEFQIIGNQTFLVTTNGKGYFLKDTSPHFQVNTGLNLTQTQNNNFFNIIIRNYKDRALIISSNGISLCRNDQKSCVVLEQFQKVMDLFDAEIFIQDTLTYLFLMTGDEIVVYQITAGNLLKNQVKYDQRFFQTDKIHVRHLVKGGKNQLLVLDSRRGVIQVKYIGKMSNFTSQTLVYQQSGCYLISSSSIGGQIVLTCSLSQKSFFIQKLILSHLFLQPHYQVTQTIFTNQKIYDNKFSSNFIMNRIYSGVRMYWTSDKINNPYPYDFNFAGNIFLHNALQSKLKIIDGRTFIFISTDDQIRRFQLKIRQPNVRCYSLTPINQEYKLTYSYPCENPTQMRKICQSQEKLTYSSWEHSQIKINTMLIPLGLSLIGAFVIIFVGFSVYKKYQNDIERAKLKYSSQDQFGM